MAYIGKEPQIGNYQKCDAITTSGTTTFNLLVSSVAVFPESANHCIVSLNGVIQAPTSAFTISGSTIIFNSALTSADVIDFVMLLGNVLDLGTVSDDTITAAKIVDNAINSEHYTDGSIDTAHIADNQITLAKLAGGTDGNIISYDASGNPVAIATGSDGQVLTSTGAGSPPAFEAAPGGMHTYISTTTIDDDATVAITGFDSTYSRYYITINNLKQATNAVTLYMQVIIGGSVQTGTNYTYGNMARYSTGSTSGSQSGGDGEFHISAGDLVTGTSTNLSGEVLVYNPSETSLGKLFSWSSTYMRQFENVVEPTRGGGWYKDGQAAVTGVSFKMASGNITSGVIKLYGIT